MPSETSQWGHQRTLAVLHQQTFPKEPWTGDRFFSRGGDLEGSRDLAVHLGESPKEWSESSDGPEGKWPVFFDQKLESHSSHDVRNKTTVGRGGGWWRMSAGKAVTVRGTQLVKRHFKERQAEGEKERGTRRRGSSQGGGGGSKPGILLLILPKASASQDLDGELYPTLAMECAENLALQGNEAGPQGWGPLRKQATGKDRLGPCVCSTGGEGKTLLRPSSPSGVSQKWKHMEDSALHVGTGFYSQCMALVSGHQQKALLVPKILPIFKLFFFPGQWDDTFALQICQLKHPPKNHINTCKTLYIELK